MRETGERHIDSRQSFEEWLERGLRDELGAVVDGSDCPKGYEKLVQTFSEFSEVSRTIDEEDDARLIAEAAFILEAERVYDMTFKPPAEFPEEV